MDQWTNLFPNFAAQYRAVGPSIPVNPWFFAQKLSLNVIISTFSRRHVGAYPSCLTLSNYHRKAPLCASALRMKLFAIYLMYSMLVSLLALSADRTALAQLLNLHDVPFNELDKISFHSFPAILSVIYFFTQSGSRLRISPLLIYNMFIFLVEIELC